MDPILPNRIFLNRDLPGLPLSVPANPGRKRLDLGPFSKGERSKRTAGSNPLRSSNESVRTAGPLACPAPSAHRETVPIRVLTRTPTSRIYWLAAKARGHRSPKLNRS